MSFMPFLIAILLVILDQLTKYMFYDKHLFSFAYMFSRHVFNKGISWGIEIFSNHILILITLLIIIGLIYLYKKKYIGPLAFTLLFAGGIGNLIDRIYLGGVRDFITIFDFFPTFNFADMYITLGVIMIFIEDWLNHKN